MQYLKTVLCDILCLFAHWEYRPSTKECYFFLFVVIFSISLLAYPISFGSFSVFLSGIPWPFSSPLHWAVPCDGLTGEGSWRFLKHVSYIHLHFLFVILFSTGSCLIHSQSVVLGALCDHFVWPHCKSWLWPSPCPVKYTNESLKLWP